MSTKHLNKRRVMIESSKLQRNAQTGTIARLEVVYEPIERINRNGVKYTDYVKKFVKKW